MVMGVSSGVGGVGLYMLSPGFVCVNGWDGEGGEASTPTGSVPGPPLPFSVDGWDVEPV